MSRALHLLSIHEAISSSSLRFRAVTQSAKRRVSGFSKTNQEAAHTRDESTPHFPAIHGQCCPGLQFASHAARARMAAAASLSPDFSFFLAQPTCPFSVCFSSETDGQKDGQTGSCLSIQKPPRGSTTRSRATVTAAAHALCLWLSLGRERQPPVQWRERHGASCWRWVPATLRVRLDCDRLCPPHTHLRHLMLACRHPAGV